MFGVACPLYSRAHIILFLQHGATGRGERVSPCMVPLLTRMDSVCFPDGKRIFV